MPHEPAGDRPGRVLKLCGADVELGNFILGGATTQRTGREASRALLAEIEAPYAERAARSPRSTPWDPQDWARKYLGSNGGCFYIDLDHLECCLPEVLSAHDHVAAWHAMLRIARRALDTANTKLSEGRRIHVLVNNSDGHGNAYGSHLNFLVTRRAWHNIFERKPHHMLYLAAFQVSSIVYTGQGKVGAENGTPAVAFQLSQRADFFEALTGVQTTYERPIVNSRDEPLCGPRLAAHDLARLHCIFFDNTLCHGSSLLKVGTMQLVLALLEAERVNPALLLDDPLAAVVRWSHDPTLTARARLASGRELTAVELQLLFLEEAQRFAATGGFDDVVPRAGDILTLWEDTLQKLRVCDVIALASRLDWVLKFRILQRAVQHHRELGWTAPEIKHLDHLYGSLDRDQGLYWAYERLGAVERHVAEAEIERFVREPPENTRAWTRATLLRLAAGDDVEHVDWDTISFRRRAAGRWPIIRTVRLDDPLGFTRSAVERMIANASTLDEILDALQAAQSVTDDNPSLFEWYHAEPLDLRSPVPGRGNGNGGLGEQPTDEEER